MCLDDGEEAGPGDSYRKRSWGKGLWAYLTRYGGPQKGLERRMMGKYINRGQRPAKQEHYSARAQNSRTDFLTTADRTTHQPSF